ncbi:MAG: hypothetical protein KatS3mg078_1814 [Deltaproteobacteria bacterium]|jgi:hypothetical protein|nr:MAG: hypothetical protein KatS3mg078_1814 [Deltaproteobacteria bacterium]
MLHIRYRMSPREDKSLFWIKPLWCPISRPFCVARWHAKQGMNMCPFYQGVRREVGGQMCVWCRYDEQSESNFRYVYSFGMSFGHSKSGPSLKWDRGIIPEMCRRCMYYMGSVCMCYGEFREKCSDFIDLLSWLQGSRPSTYKKDDN